MKLVQLLKKSKESLVESYIENKSSQFFERVCIPRLVDLLKCTPTIVDAMRLLETIYKRHRYYSKIADCNHYIDSGYSFVDALRLAFPKLSSITIEMIRIGESGGSLDGVLLLTAQHITERNKLKQSLMTASLYPIILTFAMGSLIGFLVLYIFPKILPVLVGMKVKLPLLTRMMIWIVDMARNYWWVFILFGIIGVLLLLISNRYQKMRRTKERLFFSIPMVRNTFILKNSILVFRTLAMFLQNNPHVSVALGNAAIILSEERYMSVLTYASQEVLQGKTLFEVLEKDRDIFIPEAYELILIGEKGGSLPEMCSRIADSASDQLNKKIQVALKFSEPVIMLVLGLVVAIVALAFLLPLYSITSNVGLGT